MAYNKYVVIVNKIPPHNVSRATVFQLHFFNKAMVVNSYTA